MAKLPLKAGGVDEDALGQMVKALGLEADEGNRALRRVLAALEGLENHAFQLFVECPRLAGQGRRHAQQRHQVPDTHRSAPL